jgi:hypothetical protein
MQSTQAWLGRPEGDGLQLLAAGNSSYVTWFVSCVHAPLQACSAVDSLPTHFIMLQLAIMR